MNANRMDSETVERLLDGAPVDPQDGQHPLMLLLSAVRAAPCPSELAGEVAAVRAYRMARLGTPLAVPAAPRRGFTLTGIGVRAALAGLLVASTGGVALAAGVLPNPLHPQGPPTTPSTPAVTPADSPTNGTGPRPTPPGASGRPGPDPSAVGLCRAYRAEAGDNPGQALDNPAFAGLVHAAGGRDRVPGYCERVLAEAPDTDPHATPSDRPGNQPSTRPTGPGSPAATPTRRPATPSVPDPEPPTSPPNGGH